MKFHDEAKKIIKLLWALVGLTLAVTLLINLAMGWGIVNQRDSQNRLLAENVKFTDRTAEIRLLLGLGQSTIRGLLDINRRVQPQSSQLMVHSLNVSLQEMLGDFPEEQEDEHGRSVRSDAMAFETLAGEAQLWRERQKRLVEDIGADSTLNIVRQQLSAINATINGVIGRDRVRGALEMQVYMKASRDEKQRLMDKIMQSHRLHLKGVFSGLQRELADVQKLVEVLAGEDQFDRLSDIKENMLKPSMDRLQRDVRALARLETAGAKQAQRQLGVLWAAILGAGYIVDDHSQGIQTGEGGLYNLRRDFLMMEQKRADLEIRVEELTSSFERSWSGLLQHIQDRLDERERLSRNQLAETWVYVLVLSLLGAIVFLILVRLIFKAISEQVETLSILRREAEISNEVKSKFLASMSHELRTPLNAIIGFSEVMREEAFGPLHNQKYAEYTKDIHLSGKHLLDIIDDILDVSSIEAGKFEINETDFDISGTVLEAVQMVRIQAAEAGVNIRDDVSGKDIWFHADQRLVRQIIVNLLSNAVKFTPSGGEIRLECAFPESGELILAVTDTGIGMDEAGIKTALTPFGMIQSAYEGKNRGTGLGLPLAKNMMELHGGRIEVESEPHIGTRVSLIFPAGRLRDRDAA